MAQPFITSKTHPQQVALLWKVLSYACFAGIAAIVRYLTHFSSTALPPFELAFFEACFGAIFVGVAGWFSGIPLTGFFKPSAKYPFLTLGRALCASLGIGLWCLSLQNLPLPTLSIFKLLSPLLTVFAAYVFLKESVLYTRLLALGVSLFGTFLLFLHHFQATWGGPSLGFFPCAWVICIPLCALVAFTGSQLLAKRLLKKENPFHVTQALLFFMGLFLLIPTYFTWVTPTLAHAPLLGLMGLLSGLAYYALNRALHLADLSFLMPLSFIRFALGALLGYVCFGETLSPTLVLAVGATVAVTVWFLHNERP